MPKETKEIINDVNQIGELVRKAEQDFITGYTQTSTYVSESLFEDINKIEAYLNSKHTSGETDSLGREKPFFNISIAKKNITARATDIDRKNCRAKADKLKDQIASYLFTIHLQRWMRDSQFGMFLNNWGDYLAAYNSAVVKFVEKDGELKSQVIPWNRLIVDVIDFDANPVIEILEFTPAQLKQHKGYDKDMVDLELLRKEIMESSILNVEEEFSGFRDTHEPTPTQNLYVLFISELSGADQTTLDGIVTAHNSANAASGQTPGA